MKVPIWIREAKDKKSYTMYTNTKPKKELGESIYFIGNVTNQEQGNQLKYKNGKASIYELIQYLKESLKQG